MASTAPAQAESSLFVRKASGLIKSWSPFDGFVYAFFAVTPISAFYSWTFVSWAGFKGSIFWGAIIAAIVVTLMCVVYAALITAVARSGGDYLWQTRILHSSIGFVFPVVAYWMCITHWMPLYAYVMVSQFIAPMTHLLGVPGAAAWMATQWGVFTTSMVATGIATLTCVVSMKQGKGIFRWCFYIGVPALAIMLITLLVTSKTGFISAFNSYAHDFYGSTGNAYAANLKSGGAGQPTSIFSGSFWEAVAVVPFLYFWMLWPNWGATLSGEIRGVNDFWKNVKLMGGGLWLSIIFGLLFLLVISKTMGYQWFMATGASFWNGESVLNGEFISLPAVALAPIGNSAIEFIVLLACTTLFAGWCLLAFLSATRVIFAAGFDRVLPDWVAKVNSKGIPVNAVILMVIPSLIFTTLYAFTDWFITLTLDATLMIAIGYYVTVLAGVLMPWRLKTVYKTTPFVGWTIGGFPVISLIGIIFMVVQGYMLYLYFADAAYGVNNSTSLWYILGMYIGWALVWVISYVIRRARGLSLEAVAHEIPGE